MTTSNEGVYMAAIRALLQARDDDNIVTAYPVWEDGVRAVIFAVVPGDDYPEQKINRIVERMMLEEPTSTHQESHDGDADDDT